MAKKRKNPQLTPRQQEQLAYAKWEASVKTLQTSFAREKHPPKSNLLEYKLTVPEGRSSRTLRSLSTVGGGTAKPADKVYTGTKMLGVGVLHKSNAVPVFSEDDAKDLAKMRR